MNQQKYLKELLTYHLKQKLSKVKQDLEPFPSPPPDLTMKSYGLTLGYIDIVTEKEIEPERIAKWKNILTEGNKLIIIVPKEEKVKITETLWKEGLAEKISIGTYEINLFLP